ncbi:DUF6928 family protein [Actinoplanes sp. NPDC000266]
MGANIGEPYDFERPHWAGERPVGSTLPGDPYPLPFHPLTLGEDALRALFGFILAPATDGTGAPLPPTGRRHMG